MKKILFIVPLMAISLLACNNGGGDEPGPTPKTKLTVTFDAGDGEFPFVGRTTSLKVSPNENLVSVIRAVVSPIKTGTKFAYFTYKDGSNITYEDKITKNTVLKAKYINSTLDELSWDEIKLIAIGGHPRDYFHIGETKRVQLVQQDSAGDGADVISGEEIYQTVRIIDFDKDYINLDDEKGGRLGITFEFKNLISDRNGNSLAAQWLDTANDKSDDYKNSSIRKLLNGTGEATHFLWAEKGALTWSNTYTDADTVLSMLPDSLARNIAITPKYTEHKKDYDDWVDIVVKDKLFMLSIRENGFNDPPQELPEHTSTYEFYKGHTSEKDPIRIKKQINDTQYTDIPSIPSGSGQIFIAGVQNHAGYNNLSYGGYYWLRTPMRMIGTSDSMPVAWGVDGSYNGYDQGFHISAIALGIAPAFCI